MAHHQWIMPHDNGETRGYEWVGVGRLGSLSVLCPIVCASNITGGKVLLGRGAEERCVCVVLVEDFECPRGE